MSNLFKPGPGFLGDFLFSLAVLSPWLDHFLILGKPYRKYFMKREKELCMMFAVESRFRL